MHDTDTTATEDRDSGAVIEPAQTSKPRRRRAASRAAGPPVAPAEGQDAAVAANETSDDEKRGDAQADAGAADVTAADPKATTAKATTAKAATAKAATAKATTAKATTAKTATAQPADEKPADAPADDKRADAPADDAPAEPAAAEVPPARKPRKRATRTSSAPAATTTEDEPKRTAKAKTAAKAAFEAPVQATDDEEDADERPRGRHRASAQAAVLFQPPSFEAAPRTRRPKAEPDEDAAATADDTAGDENNPADPGATATASDTTDPDTTESDATDATTDSGGTDDDGAPRRRRRRGGRGRRKRTDEPGGDSDNGSDQDDSDHDSHRHDSSRDDSEAGPDDSDDTDDSADGESTGTRRRRRRRKRKGDSDDDSRPDDPPNTVVKVRDSREGDDEVTVVKGSTRLEAKKQRRREGREAGRRRPPILSEAEFLARREAVDRVMAVRESGDLTQIAVLEDDVLVEHYVSRASQQSLIGNVYLGRVQNVLPAMEAAFVDIGRGRNAVLYAGEVDWSGLGKSDGPKRIEEVLKSGQAVLVQVTKDPIGHKGARLTSQVSLPGRYVVYVPGGAMSGISRKLPDTERTRLKKILKQVVPEDAGVIVRTAAEGASEEELTNDVERLQAQWEAIQKKSKGNAPVLLQGEPDLAIKVVRDLFNEDFAKLVVAGDGAWQTIDEYVSSVAGTLRDRVEKWTSTDDVFATYRVDEQIAKALDRKVWLPSGGSLVIDRTEAMTVVDVNTGKFTGSGGNLEETVTKNNLEAAEEIVRQLRLRDIGGIIVIDFIDMVLEANRDLVLRRLVECLGRDRTKHQVAEVTSLGLVQMTRKRIGTGLLEAFSEPCPHCNGRGLTLHTHPVEAGKAPAADDGGNGRSDRRGGRRRKGEDKAAAAPAADNAAHAPKLEALASPGEASPADLIPVDGATNGTAPDAAEVPDVTEGPKAPEVVVESAPAESESAGGAPAENAPAKPRRRRRAQRPAGSPDSASTDSASTDSAARDEESVTAVH